MELLLSKLPPLFHRKVIKDEILLIENNKKYLYFSYMRNEPLLGGFALFQCKLTEEIFITMVRIIIIYIAFLFYFYVNYVNL